MNILFWNVQRLSDESPYQKQEAIAYKIDELVEYYNVKYCTFCEMLRPHPWAEVHTYKIDKWQRQLAYGAISPEVGKTVTKTVIRLSQDEMKITPEYFYYHKMNGIKGQTDVTRYIDRKLVYFTTYNNIRIGIFHAPASYKAPRVMYFILRHAMANWVGINWVIIGDFNVEPVFFPKGFGDTEEVNRHIYHPGEYTHFSKKPKHNSKTSIYDYAISNIQGCKVQVQQFAGCPSDHYPIIVTVPDFIPGGKPFAPPKPSGIWGGGGGLMFGGGMAGIVPPPPPPPPRMQIEK